MEKPLEADEHSLCVQPSIHSGSVQASNSFTTTVEFYLSDLPQAMPRHIQGERATTACGNQICGILEAPFSSIEVPCPPKNDLAVHASGLKEKKTGLKAPLIPAADFSSHNLQAFSPAVRHLMQAFLNVCQGQDRAVALPLSSGR